MISTDMLLFLLGVLVTGIVSFAVAMVGLIDEPADGDGAARGADANDRGAGR